MNFLTILPLAVVMVAGTQPVAAVLLASAYRPRAASLRRHETGPPRWMLIAFFALVTVLDLLRSKPNGVDPPHKQVTSRRAASSRRRAGPGAGGVGPTRRTR